MHLGSTHRASAGARSTRPKTVTSPDATNDHRHQLRPWTIRPQPPCLRRHRLVPAKRPTQRPHRRNLVPANHLGHSGEPTTAWPIGANTSATFVHHEYPGPHKARPGNEQPPTSGRVSTMLPRRRSSPRWNGKCCPAIVSVILSMRRLWLSTGATPSTITNAGTVPPTGSHPSTTRSGNPRPSRKRHRKPSTISGEPQVTACGTR